MVNGQKQHVRIDESITVFIGGLHISAPGDSPNTDGIHIQGSQHFNIENSYIATGDDCISIGDGSYDVNISQVTCGPGHGIRAIHLNQLAPHNGCCTWFTWKTDFEKIDLSRWSKKDDSGVPFKGLFSIYINGAWIKTWQGGSGFTRNIIFENLNFTAISNRIVINQYYCPDKACQNQGEEEVTAVFSNGSLRNERFPDLQQVSEGLSSYGYDCWMKGYVHMDITVGYMEFPQV
ncbi:probable polygalacturonase At2g43860 [Amborella trichopoda]|uniref:probable polygalacturonase At2g43860 n=1 Tax=Amborella trichopoda TaxID=13333 RepID=UPI0009BE112D|nr:probable polygalacturonase At2g43860 [Amborella trichopoda]|eukprot:XP_020519400.1 probable polygalacturonase At2g43860 [Amborella trichopoda]